jgi:hypothetical protein
MFFHVGISQFFKTTIVEDVNISNIIADKSGIMHFITAKN